MIEKALHALFLVLHGFDAQITSGRVDQQWQPVVTGLAAYRHPGCSDADRIALSKNAEMRLKVRSAELLKVDKAITGGD